MNLENCFNHKVRTYKEYHSVRPSSELGLPPTPHPQASVPPPPCFWGEGNTRWRLSGEKGVGRVPIPTRGILCGTLYMYVLCGFNVPIDSLKLLPHHFATSSTKQNKIINFYIFQTAVLW